MSSPAGGFLIFPSLEFRPHSQLPALTSCMQCPPLERPGTSDDLSVGQVQSRHRAREEETTGIIRLERKLTGAPVGIKKQDYSYIKASRTWFNSKLATGN